MTVSKHRRAEVRAPAKSAAPAATPGRWIVSIAFFLSGSAGLIFQVVWLYRSGLVFGNSIWAAAIVLSSFMAGLALGSACSAGLQARPRALLLTYSALELVVAFAGIGLTYALPSVTTVFAFLTTQAVDAPWLVNLVRLATAFAVLLIPSAAMGATLPVLLGAVSGQSRFAQMLGQLYGLNTLGAVAGALGAELVLIGQLGVIGSAWIATLLNLTAALLVWWAPRVVGDERPVKQSGALATARSGAWLLLLSAFLTGGTLMALEIIWFRFLTMFVVSTTLAASLMLAVVLSAIGLGALAGSIWLTRHARADEWLPALSAIATIVTAITYAGFQSVTSGTQVSTWPHIVWFAAALTFPTAFLSGLLFTLIGQTFKRDVEIGVGGPEPAPAKARPVRRGSSEGGRAAPHVADSAAAGWLTLANTTGAMLGPLVAAFVLLPQLGMERSLFGMAAIYLLIGLLIAWRPSSHRHNTGRSRLAFVAASIAAVVVMIWFPFGLMASGYFVRVLGPYTAEGEQLVATREGTTATLFLTEQARLGRPVYHRLITNGFSMTGTSLAAQRYMRYFAYWPLLLRDEPVRRVLLICYGMGITLQAINDLESVESIDVVEISSDMVAMSEQRYDRQRHPLRDPRVRLRLEDGRYFLQTTRQQFDLITGEPPPPLTPGTVNLYTREYFQLMHDRLHDGGVATYWLPVARQSGTDMAAVIRAFCDVFANCSLWNGTPADLMLVGVRGTLRPMSGERFAQPWARPLLDSRLREVGFELPEQIGATFIADGPALARLTADAPPLTDDHPQRLWLPRTRLAQSDPRVLLDGGGPEYQRVWIDPGETRHRFDDSVFVRTVWPDALRRQTLPYFDLQRSLNRLLSEGANPLRDAADLDFALTSTPLRTLPAWLLGLGNLPFRDGAVDIEQDGSGRFEYFNGLAALAGRDYPQAVTYLTEADTRGLGGVRTVLAYALCLAGRVDEARRLAATSPSQNPDIGAFWKWLDGRFALR